MSNAADGSCPSTAEQLVVSGANGVCSVGWPRGASGTTRPDAVLALGGALTAALTVTLIVAFAFALARRGGLSRGRAALLLLGVVAVAAPGEWAVLVDRGDAPFHGGTHAADEAAKVTNLVGELSAFAQAHDECLEEVHNDCLACQPILRFVLPTRAVCTHRAGRIDLRADALATALTRACVVRGDALECGGAPL